MTTGTGKNAPATRGRPFVRGNPGRPKGARNRSTLAAEALLEAQRRQPWADGIFNIGGGVDLTTVGPGGLTLETLHTWPDEVGRRIGSSASRPVAA